LLFRGDERGGHVDDLVDDPRLVVDRESRPDLEDPPRAKPAYRPVLAVRAWQQLGKHLAQRTAQPIAADVA
jgi:hypothetical protein